MKLQRVMIEARWAVPMPWYPRYVVRRWPVWGMAVLVTKRRRTLVEKALGLSPGTVLVAATSQGFSLDVIDVATKNVGVPS